MITTPIKKRGMFSLSQFLAFRGLSTPKHRITDTITVHMEKNSFPYPEFRGKFHSYSNCNELNNMS